MTTAERSHDWPALYMESREADGLGYLYVDGQKFSMLLSHMAAALDILDKKLSILDDFVSHVDDAELQAYMKKLEEQKANIRGCIELALEDIEKQGAVIYFGDATAEEDLVVDEEESGEECELITQEEMDSDDADFVVTDGEIEEEEEDDAGDF
jgi:hypothetical protein